MQKDSYNISLDTNLISEVIRDLILPMKKRVICGDTSARAFALPLVLYEHWLTLQHRFNK
jgi:hypothetical protein